MSASFYASPLIGATTTLACFAHEIPHEIADYSILIRAGFSKRDAMRSQFMTAVGAFVSGDSFFFSYFIILFLFYFRVSVSYPRQFFGNILPRARHTEVG